MTDFIDPYIYPDSTVLRNIPGLLDAQQADAWERRMTLLRRRELELSPVDGVFDLDHLCEMHRRLYQDVWEWAGLTRTVEILKGTSNFHNHRLIKTAFEHIHNDLFGSPLLNDPGISDEDFIVQTADLLEKVNFIHPFREGNGRTQRAYIDQIAKLSGRTLSWRNVGKIDNERASIKAFQQGSGVPLQGLIEEVLKPPLDGLSLLDEQLYTVVND